MAVKVKSKTGKDVILLNPQEKRNKYFNELKFGYAKTNDLKTKRTKNNKAIRLTDKQKAYRAGYIAAQNDSAKIYKHNKKRIFDIF